MDRSDMGTVAYQVIELNSVRFAVVAEGTLQDLCRRCGREAVASGGRPARSEVSVDLGLDSEALAERLMERRKRVGLTQAALARAAGVRVETLNRIERGKTTPDFATVRKLVVAMNAVESNESVASKEIR